MAIIVADGGSNSKHADEDSFKKFWALGICASHLLKYFICLVLFHLICKPLRYVML